MCIALVQPATVGNCCKPKTPGKQRCCYPASTVPETPHLLCNLPCLLSLYAVNGYTCACNTTSSTPQLALNQRNCTPPCTVSIQRWSTGGNKQATFREIQLIGKNGQVIPFADIFAVSPGNLVSNIPGCFDSNSGTTCQFSGSNQQPRLDMTFDCTYGLSKVSVIANTAVQQIADYEVAIAWRAVPPNGSPQNFPAKFPTVQFTSGYPYNFNVTPIQV